jgi:hypothetical protein
VGFVVGVGTGSDGLVGLGNGVGDNVGLGVGAVPFGVIVAAGVTPEAAALPDKLEAINPDIKNKLIAAIVNDFLSIENTSLLNLGKRFVRTFRR